MIAEYIKTLVDDYNKNQKKHPNNNDICLVWRRRLAKHTKTIAFPCDFKNNVCVDKRSILKHNNNLKHKIIEEHSAEGCCCGGCAWSFGHHKHEDFDLGLLHKYIELYDPKTGFWRLNKGCILPRGWRSSTCLGYTCPSIRKKMPRKQLQLLNFIRSNEYAYAKPLLLWLRKNNKTFSIKTIYEYVSNREVW